MGLKRLVAPTEKLLTTQELRQQISLLGDAQDEFLDALLVRATEKAEKETGRAWLPQQWLLTLDRFPCHRGFQAIDLPRAPLLYNPEGTPARGIEVSYVDENGATQQLESFIVAANSSPGRITPAYSDVWPATRDIPEAVSVKYWAGYGEDASAVPADAKHAVALMVADWFMNREATISGTIIAEVPMNARWLLDGLKTGVQPGWYGLGN